MHVCTHSIDRDRKEADLAYLFKSSLTVAEELYSDLQPALQATDVVLHYKKRDSSATRHTETQLQNYLFENEL